MPTSSPSAASFYPLVAFTPDSSVGINARITAALLAGDTEVILPPGISYLDYPIVIPKGATNLALRGHPYSGSHLQARDAMAGKAIIQVGQQSNDPSNAWDTSAAEILLFQAVAVGDITLVKLEGEPNPVVGEYYALADLATIPEWQTDAFVDVVYRSELVKVISYSAGNIGIDRPAAREYLTGDDARIYPMQTEANDVCVNITLSDFTVDGCYDEGGDLYAENGIWAVLCDGISVRNVTVSRCDENCVRFDVCRDVTVSTVAVNGDVEREELYRGLNFFRCLNIKCTDIAADKLRHGVQFSTANSDFRLVGYVATNSYDDSPDCHGGRNHRGLIADFTTDWSCKVGNFSYPTGDQDITIQNGECAEQIKVQCGSSVSVSTCTAQAVIFQTNKGQPDYWPHNCSFSRCRFVSPATDPVSTTNVYLDENDEIDEEPLPGDSFLRATGIVFNECTFVQEYVAGTSYNVNIQGYTDRSEFYFSSCRFVSKRANDQIRLANIGNETTTLYCFLQQCMLVSDVDGTDNEFGIVIPVDTVVSIGLNDCTFDSDNVSTEFIVNIGSANVVKLFNDQNTPPAWEE